MKKFTVFTILLTVVVVVVLAEMYFKKYFPSFGSDQAQTDSLELTLPSGLDVNKAAGADVLGSDLGQFSATDGASVAGGTGASKAVGSSASAGASINKASDKLTKAANAEVGNLIGSSGGSQEPTLSIADLLDQPKVSSDEVVKNSTGDSGTDTAGAGKTSSGPKDFEDESFISTTTNVYLRDEQIKSAGFTRGYLEKQQFDGNLFKTISLADLKEVEVTETAIRTKDALLAKVYIFKVGVKTNINEIYQVVKLRAGQGLGVKVNETNDFGLASFYMNDSNRSGTAFLMVRLSGLMYAFSYPKEYHAQIKNLIQLISWELG